MSTHRLYKHEGVNSRSVRVRLEADEFIVDTQDVGPASEEWWGDTDYEFQTSVPRDAWGALLLALAREFLADDARATDRLRDVCKKYDVPHEWTSWR